MRSPARVAEAVASAVADAEVLARFADKLMVAPGSECVFWSGAVSGRGHGRFWLGGSVVVIAHRFAFAVVHGPEALAAARVLGHRCDEPLCQRVGAGHVVVSSAVANRREWAARRQVAGGPLSDPRGSLGRARQLRDLARQDPEAVAGELARLRDLLGEQLALF